MIQRLLKLIDNLRRYRNGEDAEKVFPGIGYGDGPLNAAEMVVKYSVTEWSDDGITRELMEKDGWTPRGRDAFQRGVCTIFENKYPTGWYFTDPRNCIMGNISTMGMVRTLYRLSAHLESKRETTDGPISTTI